VRTVFRELAAVLIALFLIVPVRASGPSFVDLTWLSISNIYYELGALRILTDGYVTRLPQSAFFGGGGGLAATRQAFKPDVDVVKRVLGALGGPASVNLLLTGHSHFDHSFDTATWSQLTGARIVGSKTTCFQAMAEDIPAARCTAVYGGERIPLAEGVTLRVVRWNHSGDSATNPEQHNPVELEAVPRRDSRTGGLRGGVADVLRFDPFLRHEGSDRRLPRQRPAAVPRRLRPRRADRVRGGRGAGPTNAIGEPGA